MNRPQRTPAPDQAARDRIARDLDTSFLVEAGAGSGKTQSLVDRMVALLATGRAAIETLAAVTFTRKAAAELRGRFQVALETARLAAPEGGVRDRLDAALTGLERAFIGTIHSFCARLLRERPVEAGLDPDFRELEDHEDRILLERSWDEYQVRARLENEAGLRGLDEAGLVPADLESAFAAVAAFPDVTPAPGRGAPPDYGPVRAALDGLVELAAELVPRDKPEKGRDGLQSLFVRLFRRRRHIGFGDGRRLMESVELFEKKLEVRRDRWAPTKREDLLLASDGVDRKRCDVAAAKERSEAAAAKMLAAAEAFKREVAAAAIREWREYRHARALAYLGPAVAFYAERRRAEGRLNFQDQLMRAAKLLRENPEVRRYFRKRFHPLLVDEFQDTDPIQAEILFLLTGAPDTEADWTRLAPAPGSLFLVGDPKQSIYRFRRADIDIYNLVKERIEAAGGATLALSANFRSLDAIADWVNPLFDPRRGGVFPPAADPYQAGYMPLRTVRGAGGTSLFGVRKATVPAAPHHRRDDITAHDASRAAGFIAWALAGNLRLDDGRGGQRPAEPGDFLVLFRTKDRMSRYARGLEELGVPFEIAGSDAFAENAEIGEVMTLLRALDDPDDPAAAVAVLRGMFFGLSDQDLLDHRAAGGGFAFLAAAAGSGTDRVRGVFASLRAWREMAARVPPSVALETIVQDSGLMAHLVSSEMGGSRAGNILKLIEVLRGRESEDMTSFAAAVAFLDEWVGALPVEEMSLRPGRRNAVRLMNLHKAKGLEAPVVWLANPAGPGCFEPDRHVRRTGGTPLGAFRFTRTFGWQSKTVSQPVGWEESAAEERKYDEAEERRLMYVAATRARDLLVVSGYAGDLKDKKAWGLLEGGLAGIEELPECPAYPAPGSPCAPPPRRKRPVVKPEETAKGREGIRRRMAAAARATTLQETVTSLARKSGEAPEWAKGGLGLWGSEVHVMLKSLAAAWPAAGERAGSGLPASERLVRMAHDVLAAAGRNPAAAGALAEHVGAIVRSSFWARAMRAARRFYEVPFSVKVGPDDPDHAALRAAVGPVPVAGGRPVAAAEVAPVFLSGAVDLVFREEAGWVIADYKTDRLPAALDGAAAADREAALAALVDHYRPQVALYARFWARLTGEAVKEAGLYFTALDRWVPVGLSGSGPSAPGR